MISRPWIPWLMLLVLVGCSRHTPSMPELTVALQRADPSSRLGAAVLELAIAQRGVPVTDATVLLEGTMTHAGMSPVSAVATEIDPGHYQVAWTWTMAGEWVLTALITLPDGQTVERDLPLFTIEDAQP